MFLFQLNQNSYAMKHTFCNAKYPRRKNKVTGIRVFTKRHLCSTLINNPEERTILTQNPAILQDKVNPIHKLEDSEASTCTSCLKFEMT